MGPVYITLPVQINFHDRPNHTVWFGRATVIMPIGTLRGCHTLQRYIISMAYLILIRHGQSEYNEKGLWTGKRDVSLSSFGREEARQVGESIRNIEVHSVHMSRLR